MKNWCFLSSSFSHSAISPPFCHRLLPPPPPALNSGPRRQSIFVSSFVGVSLSANILLLLAFASGLSRHNRARYDQVPKVDRNPHAYCRVLLIGLDPNGMKYKNRNKASLPVPGCFDSVSGIHRAALLLTRANIPTILFYYRNSSLRFFPSRESYDRRFESSLPSPCFSLFLSSFQTDVSFYETYRLGN